jgi:anti-sigma regulatory factor (Ser/Thr protein kinase)
MEVARWVIAGIRPHVAHPVQESSQTGSLRRGVVELGQSIGLAEETVGRAAIVATELGTNLVKHTSSGGEVLYRPFVWGNASGIELISIDRGPGMANPERMQLDGVSTSGSPGTGLGAVRRLSAEYALYSSPQAGTALLSRIVEVPDYGSLRRPGFEWGVVNLPKPGETVSGDAWGILLFKGRVQVMVVDGLGHGPGAAAAAHEAVRAFTENPELSSEEAMHKLHSRLKSTRGAAVAVAEIERNESKVRYVGIGNIFGRIARSGEKTRSLVTMNGTLGHTVSRVQSFQYPWEAGSVLIMNSDGLLSNWDLSDYPGILQNHPALVAALAYRDYSRGTDDVAVVAFRSAGKS